MIEKFYKRGKSHEHHNEDAMYSATLNNDLVLMAVMDGCSSGEESQFAAALFAKILKKIVKGLPDQTDIHGEELLQSYSLFSLGMHITRSFFVQLKSVQQHLNLSYSELASTLIISIINQRTQEVWYLLAGDGVIVIDDKVEVFDQNNYPNFICYHLGNTYKEWVSDQVVIYEGNFKNFVTLATDGILKSTYKGDNIFSLLEDKEWINHFNELDFNDDIAVSKYLKVNK
ncbi:protein phosphatase 2C domain-containing protein [Flammeovirga pacifica]|uniref:PPM-type phosphatase domain-containing protein n=1 Tax=Flammeovirga pacifica TaxID=915059 RepID=A0A1S1YSR1_FLAPC|nr:protein phosphatase 2C domain-containing protein [Flammeovirga pacifica]OHX64048.1 hypothetical protein NH26_20785 [Flammeovirga pacifica]